MSKTVEVLRKGIPYKVIVPDDFSHPGKINITKSGYAFIYIKSKMVYLHRYLMDAQKGQEIDHIDRNKLNNSLENLRFSNRSMNNANKGDIKGYFWNEKDKAFNVYIRKNRKTVYYGYFHTEEEAKERHRQEHIKHFGEHSLFYKGDSNA